ncbi:helix-turn-helix domain-containing protein [Microlunatus ginsengisoli]|uniref:Short-chain fatty acyl-CoA regulator family protein n=1 Tax=Microlunatus ginsengisoli TaxID=363863 RepID=A0ABP7AV79_9ACTN
MVIGKRIRHRRKAAGLTLDALGERVGLSASAISLIETGKREAKVSALAAIAGALGCGLADLLSEAAPSRRAALELRLERAQQSVAYSQLGVQPVRTGPRLPLDALESLVALHDRIRTLSAERDATPEYARRANGELRARMRASDNYFPAIEELADELLVGVGHDGGPLTRHRVNAIAERLGFSLHSVPDLPPSTRSVTDLAGKRIFLPTSDGAAQRTLALAALGHVVLQHRPPADYAEFLAQRVEVNYFAAAVLIPQRWAVSYLREAKQAKDLEIEDLRDRYLTSYEMAAHRFTNLATTHLDIPVHFMKINSSGIIYKAYANDGVTFPSDTTGSVEGQRVCRFWTARAVFDQPDWTEPYQQYTDTPSGTFWCTAVAEQGDHDTYSVSVGTPYEHVKWFRGRGTTHRSVSRCPDPACCTDPPPALAARWQDASWPSARVHSALLASLPAGAFPGVDQTEVMEFLDRQ